MKIVTHYPLVDELLSAYSGEVSHDFTGYSNHVYRLLNFFAALTRPHGRLPDAVLIAAVFHDIGIWTASTFDYLEPSIAQAKRHMLTMRDDAIAKEVTALIANHHKIRAYEGAFADSVQPFKQADLIDVSLGMLRHGLPRSYVSEVRNAFPNAGFHRRLLGLALTQCVHEPLRPFPMLRW